MFHLTDNLNQWIERELSGRCKIKRNRIFNESFFTHTQAKRLVEEVCNKKR
jgi:hypothetical protein